MTAHDDDRDLRDLGQPGAGHGAYDGSAHDGTARDGTGHDGTGHDGTEHGGIGYGGSEDDGTDALMAAILDEPLPVGARRDPAFLAAHGAAAADLAVLREQLALIGDALAAPVGTPSSVPTGTEDGEPAGRGGAARPGKRPEPGDGAGRPGAEARSPAGADPGGGDGGGRGRGPAGPPRAAEAPFPRPRGPRGSRGSRGPHRARRPLKAALGALAAAAAATLVVGVGGWLVAQGGGAPDAAAGKAEAASDSAADERGGGGAFGDPHYLACARLVAEGTVLAVRPVPDSGRERITLEVTRSYKGESGDRVTFVLDVAGRPRLHGGDRVMIGLPPVGDQPDTVVVGEEDIAPERSRITAALPEARTLDCG
ncbi:hypothetical protein [Streptomyces viridosporus]|uniref:hypothetical protein n=1 Tax=Streptomyces viridosporus TaxID=67581 RepID=UPI000307B00F|nr:hypothetical protein [Streptomyces viridosporus]